MLNLYRSDQVKAMGKKHTVIEGTSIPYSLKHGTQIWESIDDETLKTREQSLSEERIFVIQGTSITVNPDEYEKEAELISEETFQARLDMRLAKNKTAQNPRQKPSFFAHEEEISSDNAQNTESDDSASIAKQRRRR